MAVLAVILGVVLVLSVLADLLNTLVNTNTSRARFWLSMLLYRGTWVVLGRTARRINSERVRESVLAVYAPTSVLLLLGAWTVQQIAGFGLIWWGLGGLEGGSSLGDSIYYSGVVYFTLGFGEVVPVTGIVRAGALIESFLGLLTTALVIGFLPALYSAFSDRERKLMTLDDGSEDRITPAGLIIARTPDGDIGPLIDFFKEWEDWIASVIETHTSFPMLSLFRSKHKGQHWITALGVVTDAALMCQGIRGMENREPYWCLRRSVILLDELCAGNDLSKYIDELPDEMPPIEDQVEFLAEYRKLEEHGLDMVSFQVARERTWDLRVKYWAQLEFMIDLLIAPRGFWGHRIGHTVRPELRDQTHTTDVAEPPPLR